MSRNYHLHLIKSRKVYSVEDVSKLLHVCKETVRNWVVNGLALINPGERRYLILGDDLKAFLRKMKERRKRPTKNGPIQCFRCREGVMPDPDSIQIITSKKRIGRSDFQLTVKGKCSKCGCKINRYTTERLWPELQTELNFKQADEGLEGDQLNLFNLGSEDVKKSTKKSRGSPKSNRTISGRRKKDS